MKMRKNVQKYQMFRRITNIDGHNAGAMGQAEHEFVDGDEVDQAGPPAKKMKK